MSKPSSVLVFSDVHLLTVLAQTRSYTQAAQRLGVSKASVSMRMTELERATGVPLVRRTTRSVSLTLAGQQLVDETQDAFTRIEQSFVNIKNAAAEPRGLVRVTAPVALGRQYIAAMLPSFLKQYPEIRIDLDLSDHFANLAQEGFDLAIRHTQTPPETHVAWRLRETRSVLVASSAYLREHGTPQQPADLVNHRCLLYLRNSPASTWFFEPEPATKQPQRIAVSVSGPFKANNSEVLREAALNHLGLALLPDFTAAAHLASQELIPVLPRWRPVGFFGDHIYAIRPWSAHVPRTVQCLVAHLRTCFASPHEPTELPAPL